MNESLRLRVSYVPDGDTLRAFTCAERSRSTSKGEEFRIRLAHVDAPEMDQAPYGLSARAYLRRLLALQELIELRKIGTDIHGRSVGEVIRLRDGANCGLRLVQQGYIALYRCPRERGEYYAAQDEARRLGRGIWKMPGLHQTPWLYRLALSELVLSAAEAAEAVEAPAWAIAVTENPSI